MPMFFLHTCLALLGLAVVSFLISLVFVRIDEVRTDPFTHKQYWTHGAVTQWFGRASLVCTVLALLSVLLAIAAQLIVCYQCQGVAP